MSFHNGAGHHRHHRHRRHHHRDENVVTVFAAASISYCCLIAGTSHLCPDMHLTLNLGTSYKTGFFVIFI